MKKVIVVDPGHGGKDPGAVNTKLGIKEKDIVFRVRKQGNMQLADGIANRLAWLLNSQRLAMCVLTRTADIYVSKAKRAQVAELAHADLYVSLHCNAASSSDARGYEIYYTDDAYRIAESIHHQLMLLAKIPPRPTPLIPATNNSRVMACLKRVSCPAVLIECGFITSRADASVLSDAQGRHAIAQAIAHAIA